MENEETCVKYGAEDCDDTETEYGSVKCGINAKRDTPRQITARQWLDNPVDNYLRREVDRLVGELLDGDMLDDSDKGKLVRELYGDLQKSLGIKLKIIQPQNDAEDKIEVKTPRKRKERAYPNKNKYGDDITLFVYNCFGKCIPEASRKHNFATAVYAWAILKSVKCGDLPDCTMLSVAEIHKVVTDRVGNIIPGITGHIFRWAYELLRFCCECGKERKGNTHACLYSFADIREDWEDALIDEVRRICCTTTEKATSIEGVTGNMMLELE